MSADEMPPRYRPDPWIDVTTYADNNRVRAQIGAVQLRDWLGVAPGDELGVAPKSPTEVKVGPTVPRVLGHLSVRDAADATFAMADITSTVTRYLNSDAGETLRVHNADDHLVIERVDA